MPQLPRLDISRQVNHSPHVVILGAGASVAATLNGDANGRRLPVMNDLVETVGLGEILDGSGVAWEGKNFESLYSSLGEERASLKAELENRIRDYFRTIELPHSVTVYDQLLLSLRDKDVVATFNWDPLLLQAAFRLRSVRRLPTLLFLHGCAALAVCASCKRSDLLGSYCQACGTPMQPTRLLYPTASKDYESDEFIRSNWQGLRDAIAQAYFLTIFGYSAPTSDMAAISMMQAAWDANGRKELAEIDIVDIKSEVELLATWGPFITRQHYGIYHRITDAYLAWHPRRSCEALAFATLHNDPWPDNWMPEGLSLEAMTTWVRPLVMEEDALEQSGTPFGRGPTPHITKHDAT